MSGETAATHSVIVTGGADGIGKAIAERFLKGGCRVHVCDIRPDAVDRVRAAHPALRASVADVGAPDDVARLFAEARAWMGEADVLVNNVGVGGPRAAIEDIALEEWEQTFRANVTGALLCMQNVIPAMKARKRGVILNVSTGSTRTRLPMRTPYVASKWALEGLTLNAARELGAFGVRCNAILPGVMNNARMDAIIARRSRAEGRARDEVEMDYLRFISLRCRTEEADVAEAALFLASPAAARITGELFAVGGGLEWEE